MPGLTALDDSCPVLTAQANPVRHTQRIHLRKRERLRSLATAFQHSLFDKTEAQNTFRSEIRIRLVSPPTGLALVYCSLSQGFRTWARIVRALQRWRNRSGRRHSPRLSRRGIVLQLPFQVTRNGVPPGSPTLRNRGLQSKV
jgi:hypothetical protein